MLHGLQKESQFSLSYKTNECPVNGYGGRVEPMENAWFLQMELMTFITSPNIFRLFDMHIIGYAHWVTREIYSSLPPSTVARPGTSSLPAKDNM